MSIPLQPEAVTPVTLADRIIALIAVAIAAHMERQSLGEFCPRLERWSARYPQADPDMAARYRNAVCAVSPQCRSQRGCLRRSLATAAACRLRHRSVIWCTGFAGQPFRAHAWVAVNGAPIGEPADISRYIITRTSAQQR